MSDDLEEKVTLFKDKLNEMHQDIIKYRDNFPIEMLLVSLGTETRIAGNLRKILQMIDINNNCTNYINKFNPHSSNPFLDMTTGIWCNEIKGGI